MWLRMTAMKRILKNIIISYYLYYIYTSLFFNGSVTVTIKYFIHYSPFRNFPSTPFFIPYVTPNNNHKTKTISINTSPNFKIQPDLINNLSHRYDTDHHTSMLGAQGARELGALPLGAPKEPRLSRPPHAARVSQLPWSSVT